MQVRDARARPPSELILEDKALLKRCLSLEK